MPNWLDLLRQKRMMGSSPLIPEDSFSNSNSNSDTNSENEQPSITNNDVSQTFPQVKFSNYPTPLLDQYKSYVGDMPNPDNYKLGKIPKLLAGIAGFTEGLNDPGKGVQTTNSLLRRPYEQAMENYSLKGKQLGDLADIEQKENANKYKVELESTKENRELMKTLSDMQLSSARISDIKDQINNRGVAYFNSDVDGKRYKIDKNGNTTSVGKVKQTPEEKNTTEFNLFTKKEGLQQKNRFGLEQVRQQGRLQLGEQTENREKNLAKIKNDMEQANTRLRHDLSGLTPSQQNSAYTLAVKQAVDDDPTLKKIVDENYHINESASGDEVQKFHKAVSSHLKNIRNRNSPLSAPEPEVNLEKVDDVPDDVKTLLEKEEDNKNYTLSDGSSYSKVNGVIRRKK